MPSVSLRSLNQRDDTVSCANVAVWNLDHFNWMRMNELPLAVRTVKLVESMSICLKVHQRFTMCRLGKARDVPLPNHFHRSPSVQSTAAELHWHDRHLFASQHSLENAPKDCSRRTIALSAGCTIPFRVFRFSLSLKMTIPSFKRSFLKNLDDLLGKSRPTW